MQKTYIYLINETNSDKYKIGYSKHPDKRLNEVQVGNAEQLVIVKLFETKYPVKLETYLHNLLAGKRKKGEWFELDKKNLEEFQGICERQERNFDFLKDNNTFF